MNIAKYAILASITTHKTMKLIDGVEECARTAMCALVSNHVCFAALNHSLHTIDEHMKIYTTTWIRNWILYHMWKPLYNNENRLIYTDCMLCALTTVCLVGLPCATIVGTANIKWHRRTKRSLPHCCEWKFPDRLMNNNNTLFFKFHVRLTNVCGTCHTMLQPKSEEHIWMWIFSSLRLAFPLSLSSMICACMCVYFAPCETRLILDFESRYRDIGPFSRCEWGWCEIRPFEI